MINTSKIIRQIMQEKQITVRELASLLKIKPQSLSNKLYRNNFSYKDVVIIANLLDCDVKIITRDTKKEFY